MEQSEFVRVDQPEVVQRLMAALPHRKVILIANEGPWRDVVEDI